MTFQERVAAVQSLGFNPRQAAFVTTVALHSGYCVRRQYAASTGQKYGKNVCDFLDGLIERGLARRLTFRADRGSVYHLFARPLYAALGEENNRNRRHTSPALIARKLLLLDFVLGLPDHDWYATESDKRELLVNRLGVPDAALPQRTYTSPRPTPPQGAAHTTRYLVQKLPIFLTGPPETVNFVCAVTDAHASAIEAFVRDHDALLRCLPRWTLHAVLPRTGASQEACARAYTRALRTTSMAAVSAADLAWFNRVRGRVENGDLRDLGVADLQKYRELNRHVGTSDRLVAGPLKVHRMPHCYEQFGAW